MSDDFKIVSDDLRRATRHRNVGVGASRKPQYDALEAGKTVFFPLNGTTPHNLQNRVLQAMRHRGQRVTTRLIENAGVVGIVAWLAGGETTP